MIRPSDATRPHVAQPVHPQSSIRWIAVLMAVLFAVSTASATWGSTELSECKRRIRTAQLLESCSTTSIDIDHPITRELNPTATVTPADAPGLTCSFQFWSYKGSFFDTDALPQDITVEEGTSGEATAWYLCSGSGSCPPGQHCPFRTEVYGIDASSSTFVPQPFVEKVDPEAGTGTCDTSSPCVTAPDVTIRSLTAEGSVAGLQFVGWLGQSGSDRTLNGPFQGGVKVALYRETEQDPCEFDTFVHNGLISPCRPLIPGEWLEILDMERAWALEVDRHCHYVLNCPGCGPHELCAPYGWTFEGEGVEGLRILLHDRLTGEILAKGEPIKTGGQTVWFTPEKGDFGRYFFSFVPLKPNAKDPGVRLRTRLDVSPQKP